MNENIPQRQKFITVLWPAFITAMLATGLFFAALDPQELAPFNFDLGDNPLAAYSIGFFFFWLLAAISSYGTLYFLVSNRQLPRGPGR